MIATKDGSRLGGSSSGCGCYRRRGEKHLLHGTLRIRIIRCSNLRNLDGARSFHKTGLVPARIAQDLSDPFVSVFAGQHRLCKTSVKTDDLNPVWNEEFLVLVGHYLTDLTFDVQDKDFGVYSERLGRHSLSVTELLQRDGDDDGDGRPLRVGLHRVVNLNGRASHGSLEYFVEFLPRKMLSAIDDAPNNPEVPGVYFGMRKHNAVKLYVNADDGADGLPVVTYGGANDDEKVWKPPRLWRDIYDAICGAERFIYITGWAVDTKQSLLRGQEREEALKSKHSPYIGELLKQKADEGVVVNMLVWSDATSNPTFESLGLPGMMGTHDEESKRCFQGSKVNFKLAPMVGDETNALHEKAGKYVMFTHHQKLIILDAECEDRGASSSPSPRREPLAFVGGIDLTDGRWDNHSHPLFQTLGTYHKGDAYNKCFLVDVGGVGPRQPWRDIHSAVRGPGVLDVLANFTERWRKQASEAVEDLLDMSGIIADIFADPPPEHRSDDDEWCTQLLRSIDSRTALFERSSTDEVDPVGLDDMPGVTFESHDVVTTTTDVVHNGAQAILNQGIQLVAKAENKSKLARSLKSKAEVGFGSIKSRTAQSKMASSVKIRAGDGFEKMKGIRGPPRSNANRSRRFRTLDHESFKFIRALDLKKGREIDTSVHSGMIHHIRRAQHFVYVESQYFLGSSHLWSQHNTAKCSNLVPSEITLKILQKIDAGERFAVYVVLPMWPEGIPHSAAVQSILYWQQHTMASMYKHIGEFLNERKALGRCADTAHPRDYLNFYCLATKEPPEKSTASVGPKPGSIEEVLFRTRRHQIYVHSKLMIVDDEIALVGSANINQRSLDGARDSEVVLVSLQPAHTATRESIPRGEVHGFRMHCWATITGTMDDAFRDPSSEDCVRRMNGIAEDNWKSYVNEDCHDMESYLVPFPITVQRGGLVSVRPELKDGFFPDTKAAVMGSNPLTVPNILTT